MDVHEHSHSKYQLACAEVHPRSRLHGIQVAPDGRTATAVIQHDCDAEEVERDGRSAVRVTPRADLYLLSTGGGYPRRLTDWGDQSHAASWSPDGAWLATEHAGKLQVISAGGGCQRTAYIGGLYHPPLDSGDVQFGGPRWSPDGTTLLFATRDDSRSQLRLAGRNGDWQRTLMETEGYLIGWDWSPGGRQVVAVTRDEDGWVGDVRLIEIKSGACRQLSQEANYEYQRPMALWAPRGRCLLVRSNRSGWSKLWTLGESGEPRPLTTGAWDDYAFRCSPDGQQVLYASRAEQSGSGDDLWIVSLAGGGARRLTEHPGVNVPLAWARGNRIFYWHSSPTEPGDLWSVPAAGGTPQRLTWSAPLGLERKLRAPEEDWVTSEDGTRVPCLIYLPAYYREGDRYPAIVWIHGGPTGASRFDYVPTHNWLANQGYVVITPNYRGSTGHGVAHMEGVAGEGLGKHDLRDVLAAASYVRTLPQVDASRGVGVGGRSWGGYLTLMAATQVPGAFSCAVAGAAISDWRIQQAQTEVRYYDHWLLGGWIYEQEERARERSPVSAVERIQAPLLVYHGEEDRDVPFAQIEQFVMKARQAGVSIDYVTYRAEGHGNRLPRNQQDVLGRTAAFFRRHLQPWNVRDNPSGDQVQY
jgi:dipeptidyl aminopeptidase/acylaminoacyl peptidase